MPGGNRDDPVALRGELIHEAPGFCRHLRRGGNYRESTFDDAKLVSAPIEDECLGGPGDRLEGDETQGPSHSGGSCRVDRSSPDRRINGVLVSFGTREGRQRQHLRTIKPRHRAAVDDLQGVARQGSCLVGAQDVHGGSFVRAERRVSRTPRRASAWALTAAESVNVAGKATEIVANSTVRARLIKSGTGNERANA